MVLVKYHGIQLGVDADGKPRLLQLYNAGAPLVLKIGDVSDPVAYEEALRLKTDFGNAFEIVGEAEIPETAEEAAEIEAAVEEEAALAVGSTKHIPAEEMKAQEAELDAAELKPGDIMVMRKARKERDDDKAPFDKTVTPIKLSRRKLTAIKKKKLWALYRKWHRAVEPDFKLDKDAKKPDIINAILEMQG